MTHQHRLNELEENYLDIVVLIAKAKNRGANYRDFLDPWWSFSRGSPFVRANDNPSQHILNNPCACSDVRHGREHRRRLLALDWISDGARAAFERGVCKDQMRRGKEDLRQPEDRLIVEHSVPLAVLGNLIFAPDKAWTRDSLRQMLKHHMKRALLTKEEDRRLSTGAAGRSLASAMPREWTIGGDPYARYRACGIGGCLGNIDEAAKIAN